MELHHLRHFRVLARPLNYTRAAEKLSTDLKKCLELLGSSERATVQIVDTRPWLSVHVLNGGSLRG